MFGFALILTIAVMGGLIAFIGDELGYKLGKRRFSMLGIRPKYTSAIMAVLSGVVIAGGAVLTLYMASGDVRTALFGMERLRGQLTSMSREIEQKSDELTDTQKQLNQRMDELSSANKERDKANASLSELETAGAKAQADLAGLQAELSDLRVQNDEVQEVRDSLQKEVAGLERETERLEEGLVSLRAGQIVFRANQLLYAGILRGGQGEDETFKSLSDFLAFANRYLLNTLQITDQKTQLLLIPSDNLVGAAQYMLTNTGPLAVRLQAAGNIVLGERVLARLYIYPNKLIYKEQKPINSEVVPAGTDERTAEEVFLRFLSATNQKAQKDGVLPDPLTGNVGSLELPQMAEAVSRMRAQEGAFILSAVAREDVYTIGPLRVEITVRPQS